MENFKKFLYISGNTEGSKLADLKDEILNPSGKYYKTIVFAAETSEIYNRGVVYGLSKDNEQRVDDIETLLETLVGDDADKSIRTIANEELATQLVPENAKESLDTLQEIAAWIQSHPDDASAMNQAIEDNASAIADNASAISDLNTALEGEAERAAAAEEANAGAIADEATRAQGAESDLQDAIDAEEAARIAQIGELGKNGEDEDAADHTVKSFVEAKIAEVNGDATALEARVKANEDNIADHESRISAMEDWTTYDWEEL